MSELMPRKADVGFAMCGSFCTFSKALKQMRRLVESGYNIIPILSENAAGIDTRFGGAADFCAEIEQICGNKIINSIVEAEPIGPKKMFDVLVVAPCSGNTLAKLAAGIVDNTVTLSVKSHLRNAKPVLLAVSTNDALGGAAKNIGVLLNYRNYYFVPMGQDAYKAKPRSVVAEFELLESAIEAALKNEQLQPILVAPKE